MQHELHHIVQSLLGRRHLEEVTGDNLAELVREHPYSPILHLLYSKKLQQSQDPRFAESVAQTALYFSNPHWLHNLLRPKTGREATRALEQAFEEKRAESRASVPIPEADDRPAREQHDLRQLPPEFADISTESQPATDLDGTRDTESMQSTPPESYIPVSATQETAVPEPVIPLSDMPESVDPETVGMESAVTEPDIQAPAIQETPQPLSGEAPQPVQADHGPQPIPVAVPAAGEGLIPLEPLYTIDYFASQGIQLTEEEKQDPLGRKLKSFTEWLKTMKRVHPTKTPMVLDVQQEDRIKENAEHSNDQSEIVTEAMAEVYLKQGLKHRAIAVYQKLSLLNPGQSASFAAKIADLNAPQS